MYQQNSIVMIIIALISGIVNLRWIWNIMFLQQACECRGNNPWGAFIGGDKSKTYGHECTSVGSGTGDDFCFVDDISACPDKQKDKGSSKLNFDQTSNWYYSYAACKGKPK